MIDTLPIDTGEQIITANYEYNPPAPTIRRFANGDPGVPGYGANVELGDVIDEDGNIMRLCGKMKGWIVDQIWKAINEERFIMEEQKWGL